MYLIQSLNKTQAVTGCYSLKQNLILAYSTRLELYNNSLTLLDTLPSASLIISCTITADHLMVFTSNFVYSLHIQNNKFKIKTKYEIDITNLKVQNTINKIDDHIPLFLNNQMVLFYLKNSFKTVLVLPADISALEIIDFLYTKDSLTILASDRLYFIKNKNNLLDIESSHVCQNTLFLVEFCGGCLVVCDTAVYLYSLDGLVTFVSTPTFKCCSLISVNTLVMLSSVGSIYSLTLNKNTLHLSWIGESCVPTCCCYLGDGLLFIGILF